MHTTKHRLAEAVKTGLAALMVMGVFGGAVEAVTGSVAGAAAPVFIAKGFAEYHDFAAATATVTDAPTVMNVGTLITGGPTKFKTKVDMTSLKILTTVPPAFGTVTTKLKTATQDYIVMTPARTVGTAGSSIKFGICGPGKATYTKTSPTCVTNTVKYSYGTGHFMDETVTVKGIKKVQIQETIPIAETVPTTVAQGTTFQVYLASPPIHAPATDTGYTVNYLSGLSGVIQIPSTKTETLVATSLHLIGGTKLTYKTTNITYCTAPVVTKCTAKINTGNYKTVYPYMEIHLKAADHIKGGTNVDLPGAFVTFKAIGKIGTKLTPTLTQFHINANVTLPIYGASTITATLYPSTKAKGATTPPPYKAPTPIYTVTIVAPKPTITSLVPATGLTTAQPSVVINGTGFETTFTPSSIVTSVKVGTTVLKLTTTYTVTSNIKITIKKMPKHVAGTVTITVKTLGGTATKSFKFKPPAPTISSATTPVLSTGNTTVTITGTNFFTPVSAASDITSVTVGGTVVVPTSVTATKITLKVPSHATGLDQIVVKVKSGGGTAKKTITVKSHAPTISSLLTTVGAAGTGPTTGGTTLTLTGSHFFTGFTHAKDVTALKVGTTVIATYTVVSTTKITFKDLAHKAGFVTAFVTNTNSTVTKKTAFLYKTPAPVITGISKTSGPTTGGTVITITGTHFVTAETAAIKVTTVHFGATLVTHVTSVTAHSIVVTNESHAAGAVTVTATSPGGTGTSPTKFTYQTPAPILTGATPATAFTTAPTTHTVLSGSRFWTVKTHSLKVTSVKFTATTALAVNVISATKITVKVPPHKAGGVPITVADGAGTSKLSSTHFTYKTPVPLITGISKTSGLATGGTTITITGTHFVTAETATVKVTSVHFGATVVTHITSVTAHSIVVINEPHKPGAVTVTATSSGGTGVSPTKFTYKPTPPTITTISPVVGFTTGGLTVTVTGTHLVTPATLTVKATIKFGGTSATFVSVSPTGKTEHVKDPKHKAGQVTVIASNTGGSSSPVKFTYKTPAPTITTISPTSGLTTGGTTITVTGTHLVTVATLTVKATIAFGLTAATFVSVLPTGKTEHVKDPAQKAGQVTVAATDVGGTSSSVKFTYKTPAPTVTKVTPTFGPTTGGTTVTVTGSNFVTNITTGIHVITSVSFGTAVATTVAVATASKLTAKTSSHKAGLVTVKVTNTTGSSGKLTNAYTYKTPAPTVTKVTPTFGPTTGGTTVTVTGSNFVTNITTGIHVITSVSFGTAVATTVAVATASKLTAKTSSHKAGLVTVKVTNTTGSSGKLTNAYTYKTPAPTVTKVTPTFGPTTGGTTVTVTGSNFVTNITTGIHVITSVSFGTAVATTVAVATASKLTAKTSSHKAGLVTVKVTNTTGSSGKLTNAYTYKTPAPTVTKVTPTFGPTTGGTTVTVTGSNFVTNITTGIHVITSVSFGTAVATTVAVATASKLTAKTSSHKAGLVTVKVTNTTGSSGKLTNAYTYKTPAPTVTKVTPTFGPTTGGTTVTVTGSNFVTNITTGIHVITSVSFGTAVATTVAVATASKLTAKTSSHKAGLVTVKVTNTTGSSGKLTNAYTYKTPAPTVTKVTPTFGPTTGGTTVTVTGSNFVTNITTGIHVITSVSFGTAVATTVAVATASKLTAKTSSHKAGLVTVKVTNTTGSSGKLTNAYTYKTPAPTVTKVTPTFGPTTGGTTVTVTGSNFVTNITTGIHVITSVSFGTAVATTVAVATASKLTAKTSSHKAGLVTVKVTNTTGSSGKLTNAYTYKTPAPTVTKVTPTFGPTTGGTTVTVTGSNFVTNITTGIHVITSVSFGTAVATTVAVATASKLTAKTSSHKAGLVTVKVTNTTGSSGKLTNAYTYKTPAPTVTKVTPTSGSTTGGTVVKVTGSNFETLVTPGHPSVVTSVTFGGAAAISIVVTTGTTLHATTIAHASGLVTVTVTNTTAVSGSLGGAFTFKTPPPTITTLSPTKGATTGGTTVIIKGSFFETPVSHAHIITALTFGSSAAALTKITYISVTKISVKIPAHALGTVTVKVTTTAGSATKTPFKYYQPPVTVHTVTPNSGPTTGGTSVVITGLHFFTSGHSVVTSVMFGSVAAKTVTVKNTNTIDAKTPTEGPGLVLVVVTTTSGTASTTFTYVTPTPTLSSLTPSSGPTTGAIPVKVKGSHFITKGNTAHIVTKVTIGGASASITKVTSTTTLTVTLPVGKPGKATVSLFVGTTKVASGTDFTYVTPTPTLSSLTPSSGPTTGAIPVKVKGSHFITKGNTAHIVTKVTIGGASATITKVTSTTTLTVTLPVGKPGKATVSLFVGTTKVASGTDFTYVTPTPTLSSLTPSSGPTTGAIPVKVKGSHFITKGNTAHIVTKVTIGGASATITKVTSTTTLTVTLPVGKPGKATVSLFVGTTKVASGTDFTYVTPTPTLSSLTPSSGPTTGAIPVKVKGSHFITKGNTAHIVTKVTIGGASATITKVTSTTTLTVTLPVGKPGKATVSLFVGTTKVASGTDFTYVTPAPTVSTLSVLTGTTTGGTTVVLTGSHFETKGLTGASTIKTITFGGKPATITKVTSTTKVTVKTPIHVIGTVPVVVKTTGGTVTASKTFAYTYPTTTVTAVTPNTGSSTGGTVVTITGTHFVTAATPGAFVLTVSFGGKKATFTAAHTVVSPTQIKVKIPAHVAGKFTVTVTTKKGSVSLATAFTFSVPSVSVKTLNPTSDFTTGGKTITITGSGFFTAGSGTSILKSVTFGGKPSPTATATNSTTIKAVDPVHAPGTVSVVVTTTGGHASATFTYVSPTPVLTSVTKATGPTTGGTSVSVLGSHFKTKGNGATLVSKVTFGGAAASGFKVTSTTKITVTTPIGAPGKATVSLVIGTTTITTAKDFTYVSPTPVLTSVTKATGPTTGGTSVSVLGSHFKTKGNGATLVSKVTFGGAAASGFKVTSTTKITVTTPIGAPGKATVSLVIGTTTITTAKDFTYVSPTPVLTSVTKATGPTTGGTSVSVLGSHFKTKGNGATLVSKVTFGGAAASGFKVTSTTKITVTTPIGAPGKATVSLVIGTTTITTAKDFTYVSPTPVLTSVTKATGPTTGGTSVSVLGSHFKTKGNGATLVSKVTFGGAAASGFKVTSTTKITVTTPIGAPGKATVSLVIGTTTITTAKDFTYVSPTPVLTSVTKATGPTTGGTSVSVLGSHFKTKGNGATLVSKVTFGGAAASGFKVTSTTKITVTTPIGAPGKATVSLVIGTTTITTAKDFTYVSPTPVLTSVTKATGPTTGGTSVSVLGSHFKTKGNGATLVSKVTFGGAAASGFKVTSTTKITVTTPIGAPGKATVSLVIGTTTITTAKDFTYVSPTPVLTSVTKATGPTTGGTSVSVLGSHFKTKGNGATLVSKVTFGGAAASGFKVTSTTKITVTTPIGAPGKATVSLVIGTTTITTAKDFTYVSPAPTVTTLSVLTGTTTGGTTVVLTGSHFETKGLTGASTIKTITFGGKPATITKVTSTTKVTVKTPIHVIGTVPVVVKTTGGTVTASKTFAYTYPTTTVTTLKPSTGPTTGGTAVTVTGTHFETVAATNAPLVSAVTFGGTAVASINITSNTTLKVTSPLHTPGAVTVIFSTGAGQVKITGGFTYVIPAPVVTKITPAKGLSTGGTKITFTGHHFMTVAADTKIVTSVHFGTTLGATIATVTTTSFTVKTPVHAPGVVNVTVKTQGGSFPIVAGFKFVVPALTITSVSPSSGATTGGTSVTINGSHFYTASTHKSIVTGVTFGGVKLAKFTATSTTTITVKTPKHAPGAVVVSVTTTSGTGQKSTAFTYLTPAPTLTSVAPVSGSTSGGNHVTITGHHFVTAGNAAAIVTSVKFGSTKATTIKITTTTTITAVTPIGAPGLTTVVLVFASSTVHAKLFTYVTPAPSVTSITPITGTTTGGQPVTIKGSHFETKGQSNKATVTSTTVLFGGVKVTSVNVTSTTSLIVTTPIHAPGKVTVVVSSTGGTATTKPSYTYTIPAPTITSVTPPSGIASGGTPVTIKGTHFETLGTNKPIVTWVHFATSTVGTIKVTGTGTLTFKSPAHAAGSVTVSLKTTGGTTSKATGFTYFTQAFTVTNVTPNSGTTSGKTKVTITGDHFFTTGNVKAIVTGIKFGSATVTTFKVVSTILIQATTPPHAAGIVAVTVSTTAGVGQDSTAFTYVVPAPTLTKVAPISGLTTGGTSVTLTGTHFVTQGAGTNTVKSVFFGTVAATSVNVTSTTSLVAVTPIEAAGTVSVTVTSTGGAASLASAYTFHPTKPTVVSATPSSGTVLGGTSVTLSGSHFETPGNNLLIVSAITIGGTTVPVGTVSVKNATTIVFTTPAHAAGSTTITVSTSGGTATAKTAFTYLSPKPTVTSVAPTAGLTTGGTSVTVTGTNFETPVSAKAIVKTVSFGGVVTTAAATVKSATSLVVTDPKHAAGNVTVSVATTAGSGTKKTAFTYTSPLPSITSMTPATGTVTGGTVVTITGTHFETLVNGKVIVKAVTFAGTSATTVTVKSATSLSAKTPAHAAGAVSVAVKTTSGTATDPTSFTYVSPKPSVASVTPSSGPTTGGTVLTVSGTHFETPVNAKSIVKSVSIGGIKTTTTFTVLNATTLTVVSPVHAAGAVTVTVTTVTSSGTKKTAFTYLPPKPSVLSVTPATGLATGGTLVTIAGAHFKTTVSGLAIVKGVTFGGLAASTLSVKTVTSLTVKIPAHAAGGVTVSVTTTSGTATKKTAFTYVSPKPTITSVSPTSGPTTGGTLVTVSGTHFETPVSAKPILVTVSIGGTLATLTVKVKTATSLTFKTPVHTPGLVTVTVTTTGGATTKKTAFAYTIPAPTLTKVAPTSGPTTGGTKVTLTGLHFVTSGTSTFIVTSVTIGGTTLATVNRTTATTISFLAPAHAPGAVSVSVKTTGGQATAPTQFTYTVPAPTLTSAAPTSGPTTGGTTVTLHGTHFVTKGTAKSLVTAVVIGTSTVKATASVTSTTTLTVTTPAHLVGTVSIKVTTTGGAATLKTVFTYGFPAPTATKVTPASGPTTGGTTITVTGSHFVTAANANKAFAATVSVGTTPATTVHVVSATTLTAKTAVHVPGTVSVTVTTTGGKATVATSFTYKVPAPTLVSGAPSTGPTTGGTTLTLTGTHFVTAGTTKAIVTGLRFATVTFTVGTGHLAVTGTTTLTLLTPAHGPGPVAATVTTSGGTSTKAAVFTYTVPAPTLTSASPSTGTTTGGTTVTLHGTHFVTKGTAKSLVSSVSFATSTVGAFTVTSTTTITLKTPVHAPGAVAASVTTSAGTANAKTVFTYSIPAPTLGKVTPGVGPTTGGTTITVTGSHFVTAGTKTNLAVTVSVGGTPATSVTVTGTTTLTATTAAHAPGAVTVSVTTSAGTATKTAAFDYTIPAPSLTKVTPGTGLTTGGTSVTIEGSHFVTSGTKAPIVKTVVFATVTEAGKFTVTGTTTITLTTPVHAPGQVAVTVTTTGGATTKKTAFAYTIPAPTLTKVAPTSGPTTGGTKVTLTGLHFVTSGTSTFIVTSVTIGGTTLATVNRTTATTISFLAPAHAPGAVSVSVKTTGGQATAPTQFTYTVPAPTLTSAAPTSGPTTGGTTVTLHGTHFVTKGTAKSLVTAVVIGTSTVKATASVTSTTTLTVTTPAHLVGTVSIKVTTTGGAATLKTVFTYGFPAPTATKVTPASGPTTGGTTITVTGSHFVTAANANKAFAATVSVGTTPATTVHVVSATTLTAKTAVHVPGTVSVTVTTTGGKATVATSFTYKVPAPTLVSGAPSTGPTTGGTTLTLTGTHFVTAGTTKAIVTGLRFATVTFTVGTGHLAVTGTTTLTLLTPAHGPGPVAATVTTSGGTSTKAAVFTYVTPAPTLTSASPSTGTTTGGTTVTLHGTHFVTKGTAKSLVSSVSFATSTVGAFTVTSTTTITLKTPVHAPGAVAASVTTSAGTANAKTVFTYSIPAPTLGKVTPGVGPTTGGTTITVTGSHFVTAGTKTNLAVTVSVGGTLATSVTVTGTTTLTATTAAHAPGAVTVSVTTSAGTATKTAAFDYTIPAPSLTKVTPGTGLTTGGTSVTIEGSHFVTSGTKAPIVKTVVFATVTEAGKFTVTGTTTITLTTPVHAPGQVAVTVTTTGGATTKKTAFAYTIPAPTLTKVAPTSGPTTGGTKVTLTGLHFVTSGTSTFIVTSVTIGGTTLATVNRTTATTISFLAPAHAPGAVSVSVKTTGGQATAPTQFTYTVPAPTLTSAAPTSGPTTGGTTVTLHGTHFVTKGTAKSLVTAVVIGTSTVKATASVTSTTTLTVTTPAHLVGTVSIKVTTTGGAATLKTVFTYGFPAPTATKVTPASGPTTGGTTITVTGSHFVTAANANKAFAATVSVGTTPATTVHVVSATTLTAKTAVHVPGTVSVTVTTTGGKATVSTSFTYKVPAPTLVKSTPATGPTTGGTTLTLTGTHFVTAGTGGQIVSSVTVGGTAATGLIVTSATAASVVTPAHAPGAVAVVVTTSGGSATETPGFTYVTPAPTLTSASPSTGTTTGGTTVTLHGTHFVTKGTAKSLVSSVSFATSTVGAFTVTSTTTITLKTPVHAPGAVAASVTTSAGTANAKTVFTYSIPAPTLGKVTPGVGPTTGGTTITVTGSHFVTAGTKTNLAVTVSVGGTLATSVTVTGTTTLTATTAAHAPGAVTVSVTTSAGTATKTAAFDYTIPAPSLTKVTPGTGLTTGGTSVTIEGSHFVTSGTKAPIVKTVVFATVTEAGKFTVTGTTTITLTTPVHAPGQVAVTVTTTGGATTKKTAFAYTIPAPTLTKVAPTSGPTTGGTKVTLTGLHFVTSGTSTFIVTSVTIGGTTLATVNRTTATTISFLAPAHAPGAVSVSVKTTGGQATAPTQFTYTVPAPTLTSAAPTSGPTTGGTTVTLHGTHFVTKGTAKSLVTAVVIGTSTVKATASVTSTTTLTVTTPAHLVGTVSIKVTTTGGAATLKTVFTYGFPAPTATKVTPASGPTTGGTTITVTGSHFVTAGNKGASLVSAVTVGTTPATAVTVSSPTTLTAKTAVHVPGTVSVTVTTTGGKATVVTSFTYKVPAPTLVKSTPATGPTTGGTTLTLTGTHFVTAGTGGQIVSSVTVGGTAATGLIVTSATAASVVTPAHAPGAVAVMVTTSGGSATETPGFTYVIPAPTLVSSQPAFGPTTGGTTITITGTHFMTAGTGLSIVNTVTLGGVAASTVKTTSATMLTAKTPVHAIGPVSVAVTTTAGTATLATAFTYDATPPTVTKVTAGAGPSTGGTLVTITGNHFMTVSNGKDLVTSITFGGAAAKATTITVTSTTTLTVRTPVHGAGAVTVTVKTTAGTGTEKTAFDYTVPVPTITAVTPTSGSTTGGTTVTVKGTHFETIGTTKAIVTSVTFGTLAATTVTVSSTTTLTAVTPTHAAGPVGVTVVTTGGKATLKTGFTFVTPPPTLIGDNPLTGYTTGGTLVTLTGTRFVTNGTGKPDVTVVDFATTPATTLNVISPTMLTVKTPAHLAGTVSIKVTTSGGTATLKNAYIYVVPPTVPVDPTNVTVTVPSTSTGTTISVSWTVPANGGSTITAFSITPIVNGIKQPPVVVLARTASSTLGSTFGITDTTTLSGFAPGELVTAVVQAINNVGPSATSAPAPVKTLAGVPGVPLDVAASARDRQATVTWVVPKNNGKAITSYTVTAVLVSNGRTLKPSVITAKTGTSSSPVTGSHDSATIKGLVNSVTYRFTVTATNAQGTGAPGTSNEVTPRSGYYLVTAKGEVFAYGNARKFGTRFHRPLNRPIVGITATTNNKGYWLVASDGGMFAYGDARFYGSAASLHIPAPIVAMQVAPTGHGYWMVGATGIVYRFGKAKRLGSVKPGKLHTGARIVGITDLSSGRGYWLVASNGQVFAFGKARFRGTALKYHPAAKVVGIASTLDGRGYWVVTAKGHVFRFGDAKAHGTAIRHQTSRAIGVLATPDGAGYWIAHANGRVIALGDAETFRALAKKLSAPVVAMAAMNF